MLYSDWKWLETRICHKGKALRNLKHDTNWLSTNKWWEKNDIHVENAERTQKIHTAQHKKIKKKTCIIII